MRIKFIIASFFLLMSYNSYSQDFEISKKKLTPIKIDTIKEKVFIYELQRVSIYFKQRDIIEFILNPKNKNLIGNESYKDLLDTLGTAKKIIRLKNIPEYSKAAEFDSLHRVYGDSIKLQKLNTQFYFIGAALMLNGVFMLYSKEHKNFITKALFAETHIGLLGKRTLDFYISQKQKYYFIITRLGHEAN